MTNIFSQSIPIAHHHYLLQRFSRYKSLDERHYPAHYERYVDHIFCFHRFGIMLLTEYIHQIWNLSDLSISTHACNGPLEVIRRKRYKELYGTYLWHQIYYLFSNGTLIRIHPKHGYAHIVVYLNSLSIIDRSVAGIFCTIINMSEMKYSRKCFRAKPYPITWGDLYSVPLDRFANGWSLRRVQIAQQGSSYLARRLFQGITIQSVKEIRTRVSAK